MRRRWQALLLPAMETAGGAITGALGSGGLGGMLGSAVTKLGGTPFGQGLQAGATRGAAGGAVPKGLLGKIGYGAGEVLGGGSIGSNPFLSTMARAGAGAGPLGSTGGESSDEIWLQLLKMLGPSGAASLVASQKGGQPGYSVDSWKQYGGY